MQYFYSLILATLLVATSSLFPAATAQPPALPTPAPAIDLQPIMEALGVADIPALAKNIPSANAAVQAMIPPHLAPIAPALADTIPSTITMITGQGPHTESILKSSELLRQKHTESLHHAWSSGALPLGISKKLSSALFGEAGFTFDHLTHETTLIQMPDKSWRRTLTPLFPVDRPDDAVSPYTDTYAHTQGPANFIVDLDLKTKLIADAAKSSVMLPLLKKLVTSTYSYTTKKSDTKQPLSTKVYTQLMSTNDDFTIFEGDNQVSKQEQILLTYLYVIPTPSPAKMPADIVQALANQTLCTADGTILNEQTIKTAINEDSNSFSDSKLFIADGLKRTPLARKSTLQLMMHLRPAYRTLTIAEISDKLEQGISVQPIHRSMTHSLLSHPVTIKENGQVDTSEQTAFNLPLRLSFARLGVIGAKLFGTAKLHALFRQTRNTFLLDTMLENATAVHAALSYQKVPRLEGGMKELFSKLFTFVPLLAFKQMQAIKPLLIYFFFAEIISWLESKTGTFSLPLQELLMNEVSYLLLKTHATAGKTGLNILKKTVVEQLSGKKEDFSLEDELAAGETAVIDKYHLTKSQLGEPLVRALGPLIKAGNLPALIPLHSILDFLLFGSGMGVLEKYTSFLTSEKLWNKPILPANLATAIASTQSKDIATLASYPVLQYFLPHTRKYGKLRPEFYSKTWFVAFKKIATAMMTLRMLDRAYHRKWQQFFTQHQGHIKSLLGAYISTETSLRQRNDIKQKLKALIEKGNNLKHSAFLGKLANLVRLPRFAQFFNDVQPVFVARATSEVIANLIMAVPIISNALGITYFAKNLFKNIMPYKTGKDTNHEAPHATQ